MKRQCSILCGLIVVCSLVACTAIGPRATEVPTVEEPRCLAECVDLLEIWLEGAVPQEFVLTLTVGAGLEVGRVRCVDGQAIECWERGRHGCTYFGCLVKGARWYGAPDNVDVTVTWDGNQIVEHIEPNYRRIVDCFGQTCYDAEVTITLPQSP
jgi:hypothetical protein